MHEKCMKFLLKSILDILKQNKFQVHHPFKGQAKDFIFWGAQVLVFRRENVKCIPTETVQQPPNL